MRSSILPIVANRYMEQTEQSDGKYPHSTSFVVNHYFLNIDTKIGEIFFMLGIYAG